MSLDVACPEAARLILLNEEGIRFVSKEEKLGKYIISAQVDTTLKEVKNTPLKYFKEVRDFCIEIIQNRQFKLSERLYVLGDFINKLDDGFENNSNEIVKFINEYDVKTTLKEYKDEDINSLLGNSNMNYIIQINFFMKMLKILKVDKEIESVSFKNYTETMLNGYNIQDDESISKNSHLYIKAFKEYEYILENKYDYIFENYLVNYIYNNMFPFNEVISLFDTYIMLLMRVSFIKFYLVGLYLNGEDNDNKKIAEFIQVFSKTIEHHKSFLMDSLAYIKRNELNNIEFAKML